MGILLSKNLKQKQSIKLTPSLKKSIDLLQLSRFELIKKIENEIIENPFLEKQDYDYDNSFNEKDFNFDIESKLTLRETLLDQLNDFDLSNKETQISKLLIDSIDESRMKVSIRSVKHPDYQPPVSHLGNSHCSRPGFEV